jgi:hypothetical protein
MAPLFRENGREEAHVSRISGATALHRPTSPSRRSAGVIEEGERIR